LKELMSTTYQSTLIAAPSHASLTNTVARTPHQTRRIAIANCIRIRGCQGRGLRSSTRPMVARSVAPPRTVQSCVDRPSVPANERLPISGSRAATWENAGKEEQQHSKDPTRREEFSISRFPSHQNRRTVVMTVRVIGLRQMTSAEMAVFVIA